jgi:hypothetical protein
MGLFNTTQHAVSNQLQPADKHTIINVPMPPSSFSHHSICTAGWNISLVKSPTRETLFNTRTIPK